MSLVVDNDKCIKCLKCLRKCKFNAIEFLDNKISINDSCTFCNACVSNCPVNAITNPIQSKKADFSNYSGILVYVQVENDSILPISLQLINKAQQLAKHLNEKVYAVAISSSKVVENLCYYNVDKIICYNNEKYSDYNINQQNIILYNTISALKPSIVLIGATNEGREICAHLACKCKTGMTADCTYLSITDGNLLQVRPAYGGKIMAEILTENSRPQFATVKNGVFDMPRKQSKKSCEVTYCNDYISDDKIISIEKNKKANENDITKADIVLCIGGGVKLKDDVKLFEKLANKIGATLGSTRALVEKGFMPAENQIGLSGKGISPKLLITMGVSGSIQFLAGIKGCKHVIAINSDKDADILKVANYSLVADIYEIANKMLEKN